MKQLIDGNTDPLLPAVIRLVEQLHSLVFVSAGQPQSVTRTTLRFTVNKPDAVEQKRLWQHSLGKSAVELDATLDGIATQFKLSARTIEIEGTRLVPELALSARPDRLMWSACRSVGRVRLDELAQRIESVSRFGARER